MKDRDKSKLLQDSLMSAISHDYEDLAHIIPWVTKFLEHRGVQVSRTEMLNALEKLIDEGYAQAYILSSEPYSRPVEFSLEEAEEMWYCLTRKGLGAIKAVS